MKKVLVLSFDLLRSGEPTKSYAVSNLLAFAKQKPDYNVDFSIKHITYNMSTISGHNVEYTINDIFKQFHPKEYDLIAISAYVWNEYLINPLTKSIRDKGYNKHIALGGYQITYSKGINELNITYPYSDKFIFGYAEESFYNLIQSTILNHISKNNPQPFSKVVSPYLTNEMLISENQEKIRWETKRGCYYSCSFCAHKESGEKGVLQKVYYQDLEKIGAELDLFKSKNIKRINVLDPLFNVSEKHYEEVMRMIVERNFATEFTFQVRLDNLKDNNRDTFFDYAKSINCTLELGIQTLQENEWKLIKRNNSLNLIQKNMTLLNQLGINYEASLIYGLPNQTVKSFKESIQKLEDAGCKNIIAWPLMLLKGTELFYRKAELNINETIEGDFNIPTVTSSNTFSYVEWQEMKNIAEELGNNRRF